MAKPRKSKRQQQRDERRKKKHDLEIIDDVADDNYSQHPDRVIGQSTGGDERPTKRTKVHKSASGANNTPLVARRDAALFFDDVDGAATETQPDVDEGASGRSKRKRDDDGNNEEAGAADLYFGDDAGETEFFGLLTDSEHEYFRRADELLELNDFSGGDDERRVFLANVFREARGKELKVASSQSCSRLMERLIQVASIRQKKRLFAAFRGHILTLVSHRFSSHCCEQLFLQSAPFVGRDEDKQDEDDVEEGDDELPSLEESFLFVLDELEASLGSLLVHCFASHTLRVLLVILAGRPLDGLATQSLLRSKRKENIRVGAFGQTTANSANDDNTENTPTMPTDRIVPESFTFAVQKILGDVSHAIEGPLLNVLPTHPTGNPSLQLLLELDMAEKKETKGKKQKKDAETEGAAAEEEAAASSVSLLERLLPGAPGTLSDPTSQASTLVRTLIYDPIGSRLLETLIAHCPGKLFKAIYNSAFAYFPPKDDGEATRPVAVYFRNDVACYPAMRVIERLGRDDLKSVVQNQVLQLQADGTPAPPPASNGGRITPPMTVVGQLVDRGRYNVLRTLFERCEARGVEPKMVQHLVNALQIAIGGGRLNQGQLVTKLCLPDEAAEAAAPKKQGKRRSAAAAAAVHACQLLSTMLAISGGPASAVQAALLDVSGEQLTALATQSAAGARVLVAALHSTNSLRGHAAKIPLNKQLVAKLVPHHLTLANSPAGHVVLIAIIQTPSRTEVKGPAPKEGEATTTSELSLPFHLKDTLIAQLAAHEDELRQSWSGRAVWRAWKGDLWRTRRSEWVHFAKAGEPEGLKLATAPVLKDGREVQVKRGRPEQWVQQRREQREEREPVEQEPNQEFEAMEVDDVQEETTEDRNETKEEKQARKEAKKAKKEAKAARKAEKAEKKKEKKAKSG
ncbi:Nucleolar protein 9 [Sporothrix eucalyptigena]|uniref:Nucleolar protein 9 n=1 Tax=Sporothrix eucalyptigena TaxID=1812306 RepID=A0ABP0BBV3_9PEZI